MEKQVIGTRVVLRLKASATNIFLEDIADQIFFPLMREISEKLSRYGLNFSLMFYLQHQWDVLRDVDFRFHLLSGLIPEPPWDKKDCSHIRRALAAAIESTLEPRRESIRHLSGQELAIAEHSLATEERSLVDLRMPADANGPAAPLVESDMHAYIYMALPWRIQQMLNADIACGRLVVSVVDGKQVVLLDDLVAWADYREIKVKQNTLSGCEHSLVHDAYQRFRQRISAEAMAAAAKDAGTGSPGKGSIKRVVKASTVTKIELPPVSTTRSSKCKAARQKHDITKERGCRRLILENWENIELLHRDNVDGVQVLRVLKRNMESDERAPVLKTVQNCLITLRKDKLIP